jgi:hypothetical protein
MKIRHLLVNGPSFRVGASQARERYAEDGPMHIAMLGDAYVAIWDDRDPEAVLIPRERVKEMRVATEDIIALLTEPEMPAAGVAAEAPVTEAPVTSEAAHGHAPSKTAQKGGR